jgi:hypothetical protein
MNDGLGMPGSGSFGSFTPDRSAANIVEQSNPLMQIRGTSPQVGLPNVVGYDYPEDPEGINLEPSVETSGSFRRVPNPTEQAYQASLPGINRIQANAQTQMAMNRGDLDSPMDIRRSSELSPYAEDLPQNILREQTQEAVVPQEMQPSMMYRAGETAPKVADKVAKGVGGLAGGVARFGGNMLNAFLYGAQSKKGLRENLNQTFYGGKGTLGQNVLGLPAPENNNTSTSVSQGIGPTKSGEPMGGKGGFKGAFAAARKGGKKTFMYKGKKYTTALASDKKKVKPSTNKKNSNASGMNPKAKSSRYRYGI